MIAIVDYGLGNVRAFANIYKQLNIPARIARRKDDLKDIDKIILPGVGAFDHTMQMLEKSEIRPRLEELVLQRKIPVLGVCVGMQMLARSSEEGNRPGLGWIDGVVKRFIFDSYESGINVPHMGWNEIKPTNANNLLRGLEAGARFYFLHSYYISCYRNEDVIAITDYGGDFTCAVNYENIYGVQFHPEKSHLCGIRLLENFANI
jgi:glutamine amidotransferase